MRKAILIMLLAALTVGSLSAQNNTVDQVLNGYLEVKNALVKADAKQASALATALAATISGIEQQAFVDEKAELLKQTRAIASAKDIEQQRVALGLLSASLWKVIKAFEPVSRAVFYNYCPMKKAHWLSGEAAIRNPFYGNRMLTCGSVADKINN